MTGRVTGIGGVFFRARDPKALADWYRDHLEIEAFGVWPQDAGGGVIAPFAAATDYWPADRDFMLNLRVDDLDDLVARLDAAGIEAERRPDEWDTPETGRFARIQDPEGLAIELWEPPG